MQSGAFVFEHDGTETMHFVSIALIWRKVETTHSLILDHIIAWLIVQIVYVNISFLNVPGTNLKRP